jgi:hypothetical protein
MARQPSWANVSIVQTAEESGRAAAELVCIVSRYRSVLCLLFESSQVVVTWA